MAARWGSMQIPSDDGGEVRVPPYKGTQDAPIVIGWCDSCPRMVGAACTQDVASKGGNDYSLRERGSESRTEEVPQSGRLDI